MDVHLTEEQEVRLRQFATRLGRSPEELAGEAVDRMLEYAAGLYEAVEEGRDAARRGDLVEHEDVVDRVDQLFRS